VTLSAFAMMAHSAPKTVRQTAYSGKKQISLNPQNGHKPIKLR
jgi:hypothetical protein